MRNEIRELKPVYSKTGQFVTDMKITKSDDAAKYLRDHVFIPDLFNYRECFHVLYLNRRNNVIGHQQISAGSISGTLCDPKMIFSGALLIGASSIILSHNHPSGECSPSESDTQLTKRMHEGGKMLGINITDHIILTEKSYYSFADEGII